MDIKDVLKFYKDFPKEGIMFVDIIPYLQDKEVYRRLIDRIAECTTAANVAAPEARGFLFAAPLLIVSPTVHNIIPVRKSGKLPFAEGDLHEVKIVKEYGFDKLYYRQSDIAAGMPVGDVFEISIIDDVLATGGTAEGVAESLSQLKICRDGKQYSVKIKEFIFIVELEELGGAARLERIAPVKSIVKL